VSRAGPPAPTPTTPTKMENTMTAPQRTDPAADQATALRNAARATRKRIDAEKAEAAAFSFARDLGASLRDIEAATGVSHMTVKRRIEATAAEIEDGQTADT
jgi:hypothetical protein